VVFYHNDEQKTAVEAAIAENQKLWDDPIVSEVAPYTVFYPAEDYHREYFKHNPNQTYCRLVINPKVAKFRAEFKNKLK
ncbi:MAG: peptide-methionine (S)-S-oxide reductase, partial [Candidatus Wallacebacter cryptica]